MKLIALKIAIGLFTCCIFLSCFPYRYTSTPHAYGRILDNATGSPIAAAKINYDRYPESIAISDANGEFDLPQIKEWIWIPFGPFDALPPRGVLVIEADGYDIYKSKEIWGKETKQRNFKLHKKL